MDLEKFDVDQCVANAEKSFANANDVTSLENEKAVYLGKSGLLTQQLKALSQLDLEKRKLISAQVNVAKQKIEKALQCRREALAEILMQQRLFAEKIDVTLPGRNAVKGRLHPVMQTRERIENIFASIGFDVADGPEIENDWYNFTALNSAENHPARSMQDTFYLNEKDSEGRNLLLRTHTSPMQIRYVEEKIRAQKNESHQNNSSQISPTQNQAFPIKVLVPGRTYRVDSDATHSPMFNQIEGLWIDENISFANLKGVYTHFLTCFFERDDIKVRFRPSYFPFTEPSAEIDMMFEEGPKAGKWLEISGAGQIHPTVIKNMGLDSSKHIGFAFGSGLERLTMLYYGIEDLRLFFENDLRFLEQFA